jgi:hypothetical protein
LAKETAIMGNGTLAPLKRALGPQRLDEALLRWACNKQINALNKNITLAMHRVRLATKSREALCGHAKALREHKVRATHWQCAPANAINIPFIDSATLQSIKQLPGFDEHHFFNTPSYRLACFDVLIESTEQQLRKIEVDREQHLVALNSWLNLKDNAIEQLSSRDKTISSSLRTILHWFGVS